jgi:hypothetical protein
LTTIDSTLLNDDYFDDKNGPDCPDLQLHHQPF